MANKSKKSIGTKKRGTWKIVRFDINNKKKNKSKTKKKTKKKTKPKSKTKSKTKKKTKPKSNVRCFSRLNLRKKRYVTCVKRFSRTRSKQLRTKRGGNVLPLNYFGREQHKNYSKNKNKCLK